MLRLASLVLMSVGFVNVCGYKILVFSPTIQKSHMISNGRVADALAKDGHNVTLLEVEYDLPPDVVVTAHHARRLQIRGTFVKVASQDGLGPGWLGWLIQNSFSESSFWYRLFVVYNYVTDFRGHMNGGCESFIQRRDVIEMLKAEKYDVMINEQLSLCGTGYARLLGIKTHVWLSSCALFEYMSSSLGLPPQPSWVPAVFDADYSDKMSYTERVGNLLFTLANQYSFQRGFREETEVFRRHFGKDFPALDDLAKESPLTIVSVDEFVEFPRPVTHNIVYIGGLELSNHSAKSLKEPFASEMEKGKRGVVFISFGSSTPTRYFPEVVRRNMLKAISELPDYHFIMKVDKEDEIQGTMKLAKQYSNVYMTSWAPQPSILAHPRIRAFVTHGGYNSIIEAAHHAVPLVLMGFFAEQRRNSRVVERNGWGIAFKKHLLSKSHEEFRQALETVLTDKSYADNARRTRQLIKTKPFSAEERLTKWMRFLEANDGRLPELMSEGRNLGFIAFHNLDIYIPLVLILLIVAYVSWRLMRVFFSYLTAPVSVLKEKDH